MGPDGQPMDYPGVSRPNQMSVTGPDYVQAGSGYGTNPRPHYTPNNVPDISAYDPSLVQDPYAYTRATLPPDPTGRRYMSFSASASGGGGTSYTDYEQYPEYYPGGGQSGGHSITYPDYRSSPKPPSEHSESPSIAASRVPNSQSDYLRQGGYPASYEEMDPGVAAPHPEYLSPPQATNAHPNNYKEERGGTASGSYSGGWNSGGVPSHYVNVPIQPYLMGMGGKNEIVDNNQHRGSLSHHSHHTPSVPNNGNTIGNGASIPNSPNPGVIQMDSRLQSPAVNSLDMHSLYQYHFQQQQAQLIHQAQMPPSHFVYLNLNGMPGVHEQSPDPQHSANSVGSDSDEELDEEESDGSNTEALIEHLEATFKSVIDQKIEDTERFFDNHDYAITAHSISKISPLNFAELAYENGIESEENLEESKTDINTVTIDATDSSALQTKLKKDETINHVSEDYRMLCRSYPPFIPRRRYNSDSQIHYMSPRKTEENVNCVTGSDQPKESVNCLTEIKVEAGSLNCKSSSDPDNAREEIAELRNARERLVNKRKELADKIKQADVVDSSDEKKLYEYEEAIEAIDSVVDYKNEIICGRECILTDNLAPGGIDTKLITRLSKLSTSDLQRLICKYFSKVVELRHSTKRLEKGIEELESGSEQMSRRLARDQTHIKEIQTEYESRIKMIIRLHSKDPNSAMETYLRTLDKSLAAARKKQYDLERSLTELLVRHGYLLNGADYDVKQVVKMLGIDTMQMGLNWRDEGKKKTGVIPAKVRSALESATAGGQGMSRRMREAFTQRRMLETQQLSPVGAHHSAHPSSSRQHHHNQYHYSNHSHAHNREPEPAEVPQVAEVRREKRKLIIQPSQPNQPQSHHPNQQHHHYPPQNYHY